MKLQNREFAVVAEERFRRLGIMVVDGPLDTQARTSVAGDDTPGLSALSNQAITLDENVFHDLELNSITGLRAGRRGPHRAESARAALLANDPVC
jgi:hypothetical protein